MITPSRVKLCKMHFLPLKTPRICVLGLRLEAVHEEQSEGSQAH